MRVAAPLNAFPSAAFIEPRLDLNGNVELFLPVVRDGRVVGSVSSSAEGESSADVSTPGARAAVATAPGVVDFRKAFPVFAHGENS